MDLAVTNKWIFGKSERNKKGEFRENVGGCPVGLSCKLEGGFMDLVVMKNGVLDFWTGGTHRKRGAP